MLTKIIRKTGKCFSSFNMLLEGPKVQKRNLMKVYPSEKSVYQDEKTGVTIWQMTNYPSDHSNLYFTKTSFTPDGKTIIILSRRRGYANLYSISLESGEISQLTDHKEDIWLYSPCISPDGKTVYYTLENSIRSVNISTLEKKTLMSLPNCYPGELSISNDGSFLVTQLRCGKRSARGNVEQLFNFFRSPFNSDLSLLKISYTLLQTVLSRYKNKTEKYFLIIVPTKNPSAVTYIKEIEWGGVARLSPNNTHVLCSKGESEIWICDLESGEYRHLYGHGKSKWLTHPNWLSNNEVLVADWPNALITINLDGQVREISRFNLRHPTVRHDGSLIACDTTLPDTGLYGINPISGKKRVLFYPESAEQEQWRKNSPPKTSLLMPFSIRDPFGNEWHHTHQSFSQDGKKIIFNSTRGGNHSQVFIAFLDELTDLTA